MLCMYIYICLLWSFEHSGPMTLCTCVDVSVLHCMHLVRALSCGYIQGHHVSTHIQSCTDETCMYADGIYMYTIVDIVITNRHYRLINMINNLKFRKVNCNFQNQLSSDIRNIRKSNYLFVPADKTNNFYKIGKCFKVNCYKRTLPKHIRKLATQQHRLSKMRQNPLYRN